MSCETCKCDAAGCLSSQGAAVYASLLDGMHALAQPLTVLQSYFYLAQPASEGNPGQRQLLTDGATAIEHLCTLFRLMQELVHVQSVDVHSSAVPLSDVLQSLAEDAEVVFAGTGLWLDVRSGLAPDIRLPEPGLGEPVAVWVDDKLTRHALASMLHVVRECSQRNSAVRCSLSAEDGWLSLGIAPEAPVQVAPEDRFDEGSRLHLALAQANIARQQTVFSLAQQPFMLSIRLPIAKSPVQPEQQLDAVSRSGHTEVTIRSEKR